MDREARGSIDSATQRARRLLEQDFASQLEGTFDVMRSGTIAEVVGSHLTSDQVAKRAKIVAAILHKRAAGMDAAAAVADYLRDAAFTTLNRIVALKILEARSLVQECVTKGDQSLGYVPRAQRKLVACVGSCARMSAENPDTNNTAERVSTARAGARVIRWISAKSVSTYQCEPMIGSVRKQLVKEKTDGDQERKLHCLLCGRTI